jgi:hypothetical protein
MCRSIKPLRHRAETASDEEVRAAALQFVRKVSGFHRPSPRHVESFDAAVDDVARITRRLLDQLAATIAASPGGR